MRLDPLTLMAAGSFVTAASAILLVGAWSQIRASALLWWAAANAINALGIAFLMYGITVGGPATAVAAIFNALSPVMIWAGARAFNGKGTSLLLLAAGPVLLLAFGLATAAGAPVALPTLLGFAIWVVYLTAAAVELWQGRREALGARWPLIAFLCLHAFIFLGGIVDTLSGVMPAGALTPMATWFSLIHFETLIYALGTAIFMVLMCKQRSEQAHIVAANHDSLTGINNRGAFLDSAGRILARCQYDGISVALIMFDLDRFKWINDTLGHAGGDAVIRTFVETTRRLLRPKDLFCRYGGEEFAILLPGATIEAAFVIAERVRHNFAVAGAFVGDRRLNATVSGGVAAAHASEATIEHLLQAADRCLYRAKNAGRNRVERPEETRGTIARIA